MSVGAQHSWVDHGCLQALDVHQWVVVVINMGGRVICGRSRFVDGCHPWALAVCGWVAFVVNGGVICLVSHLWAVMVIHGGVMFTCLRAVVAVRGWSWLSVCGQL